MSRPVLALAAGLVGALVLAATASASTITMQTRGSTDPAAPAGTLAEIGTYYRDVVEGLLAAPAGAGFCDASPAAYVNLSNQGTCGGTLNDIAFSFNVQFGISPAQAGVIDLQVGPDLGLGSAVFLDGVLLDASNADRWWAGDFDAVGQVYSFLDLPVAAGNHVLQVYGLEHCCDGIQSARFRLNDGDWTFFAATDPLSLVVSEVPAPASLGLLLAGLAALPMARRRA